MMNLMSCHKFSLFQVWPIKVWKIFWKLLLNYLIKQMNSCSITKMIWNKKKYTMALTKKNVHLKSVVTMMRHGCFSGEKLEKLFVMTNMERDESIMKFARQLRGMGVDEALRERGAKDGDIVRIGNFEFEFVD